MDGKRKVDSNNISNGKSTGLKLMNMRVKKKKALRMTSKFFNLLDYG